MARRGLPAAVACLVASSVYVLNAAAAPDQQAGSAAAREYEIKAAFLYNFAKFVTWPENTFSDQQSPLIIGILGEDPFEGALKSIEGKMVKGRKIIIKQFNTEKDIDICHVLFISSSEKDRLHQLFNNGLSGKKILTVGNMAQFTQSGGVINFVIRKNKTKFEISRKSVEHAGLTLSSQLLKLAIVSN